MPGDGSNGELAALIEIMQQINVCQRVRATLVQNGMRLAPPTDHERNWNYQDWCDGSPVEGSWKIV